MATALSLICVDCGVILRSVKEAQDHGEATGHANFEESTEAAKRIVCKDCGKVARSSTEADLHTKRTGHKEFEDDRNHASQPINTEDEMRELDQEEVKDQPLVPAEEVVEKEMLDQLIEMGFSSSKAARALYSSGGADVEAALNWVADHEIDADIDETLMVAKEPPKKKLTPEEAKAHAADLLRRAREKREAEERLREREREVMRVKMGKELAAAARLEDEQRLKRIADERQREKEEEARAREKIRRKLEEDRRERRRKLGLPEELTAEEKEAERKKVEEKIAEDSKRRLPLTKSVILGEKMRDLLVAIKKAHNGQDEAVKSCFQTMLKICANVAKGPEEEKFRSIKLTNPAVKVRVVDFQGAVVFLELCGFQKDSSGSILEMPREKVDLLVLQTAGEHLENAINNPFFGVL